MSKGTAEVMSLTLCTLFLLLQSPFMTRKTNGLTLPLIHPQSSESPVFESNLTSEERVQRLMYPSHPRDNRHFPATISSIANSKFSSYKIPDMVRPKVGVQFPNFYIVKVGVGTFEANPPHPPFMSYYLLMDTGSDLTWMQCEGCKDRGRTCFPQVEPVYPDSQSASYHPLPCESHSQCIPEKCIGNLCSYDVWYADDTSSSGILALENFAFNSHVGQIEVVRSLAFGCGIDNKESYIGENHVAGIMGLGWGKHSILSQAISLTEGQFSYCLPFINFNANSWPNSYLRFGRDIARRPNLSVTPLVHVPGRKHYHLILGGISINQKRLKLSDRDFRLKGDGSGGCIIDSGTQFSKIMTPAYTMVEDALKKHFKGQRNLKPYKASINFNLCYVRKKPNGFKNLPSITFHFRNADLVLQPEALFFVMDESNVGESEYFCLAMSPDDYITNLGAYQQTNHRFIYDISKEQLLFSPDDCSNDA